MLQDTLSLSKVSIFLVSLQQYPCSCPQQVKAWIMVRTWLLLCRKNGIFKEMTEKQRKGQGMG
jgi:hypothetical protein